MSYKTFQQTKGRENPKVAVFDVETYKWVNPYAVGFYDGENYKSFRDKNCILDFLKETIRHKYRAYHIYAHNGGKFDFNFLLNEIRFLDYPFKLICQGGRIIQFKVYQNKNLEDNKESWNNTKFVDSFPLLKSSLDKLTKDFDVKHKKLNFMDKPSDKKDFEYLYELFKKNDERFDSYLMNDCLGLYEVLDKFIKLIYNKGGELGLTTASTSLKTFKKSFLGKTTLKMTTKTINDEIRIAYYGGRTEIFRMYAEPEGNYNWYDINSLYPFKMRDNEFPTSPPITIRNPDKYIYMDTDGITEARIEAPKKIYLPILPFRFEKLYFPVGKFTGYWDNCLLKEAKELGYKIDPIKSFSFQTGYIFRDYVNEFYKLKNRSKTGSAPYILAKHLMNNLYGKFAQHQDSSLIIRITSKEDYEKYKDSIKDVIDLDYGLYKINSESKGNHFIPQISIHVTALAQLELYKYLNLIVEKGYNIYYCDTDSIATDYKNLPCGDKLGEWKKEVNFSKGYFLLPKTYWIKSKGDKDKLRAKGYINELQNQLSENAFKKALFKNDYSDFALQTDYRFLPFKSSYRRNKTFVSTAIIKKSIKSRYDKRKILKDFNTIPFNVKEIVKKV